MHLVSEWRDFRPEYFNLGVLRTRLPDGIPFPGASATLDPRTLESVKDRCGFDNESTVIQTALDRSEIYIQTSSLQRPMNSMIDFNIFYQHGLRVLLIFRKRLSSWIQFHLSKRRVR